MKEALIEFVRGFVAAGVATTAAFLLANLSLGTDQLIVGLGLAFITGAINFCGEYLRNTAQPEPFRSTRVPRPTTWADKLPF